MPFNVVGQRHPRSHATVREGFIINVLGKHRASDFGIKTLHLCICSYFPNIPP